MQATKNLKKIMNTQPLVAAPGAYDALTAKIVESQGFPAIYMTGYGTSAAVFGLPDLGFVTMTEMVQNAARMADAVDIPLIADADTGYGNPMNVIRTVREYERAGASAIHLEDQQWPKRCGHMEGKTLIDPAEMTAKIRAAVDTRRDADFLIIARTDALGVNGLEDAVERAARYGEAGADILFVEAPRTVTQMQELPRLLTDTPLMINMAPLTPNMSIPELQAMGYRLAVFPGVCLAAAVYACNEEIRRLKEAGRQRDFSEWKQPFHELNTWLKAAYYLELEQHYQDKPTPAASDEK